MEILDLSCRIDQLHADQPRARLSPSCHAGGAQKRIDALYSAQRRPESVHQLMQVGKATAHGDHQTQGPRPRVGLAEQQRPREVTSVAPV